MAVMGTLLDWHMNTEILGYTPDVLLCPNIHRSGNEILLALQQHGV
jgi:hypothetical protein